MHDLQLSFGPLRYLYKMSPAWTECTLPVQPMLMHSKYSKKYFTTCFYFKLAKTLCSLGQINSSNMQIEQKEKLQLADC